MFALVKKHYLISVVLVVVALLILIQFLLIKNNVELVSPRHGEIVEAIYGLGKVKTDKYYDAKLAIIKSVEKVYVNEGDEVKKDQLLVKMDGGLKIIAPFAGTITEISFRESQPVFPQQSILRLEDIKNKYIEVALEQQGALRVKKGQPVRVLFESIRGEQLNGVVTSIFPRKDEFLAHIKVDGLEDNVLPGMTADIAIEINKKQNALLIPLSSVSNGQVRIIRDGDKKVLPLKIGGIDGNWAEVTEGDLKLTDQIIIRKRK